MLMFPSGSTDSEAAAGVLCVALAALAAVLAGYRLRHELRHRIRLRHWADRNGWTLTVGEPLFLSCTAWRDLAEHIAESLTKGTRVIVQGRLKLSRWENDEGEKRSAYGLDVDEIGPSLRFAQAKVTRMSRSSGKAGDRFTPNEVPDDAWNTAAPAPRTAA
jgi:single-strand DNA-binding protein